MSDLITLRGFVATAPTQKFLPGSQVPLTYFRLASTPRWFDPATGSWKEGNTNWYQVNCYRALAYNAARSLQVGHPILISGRLRVNQFERADGSLGTSIDIDAQALGHDLTYGLSHFSRICEQKTAQPQALEEEAGGEEEKSLAGSSEASALQSPAA